MQLIQTVVSLVVPEQYRLKTLVKSGRTFFGASTPFFGASLLFSGPRKTHFFGAPTQVFKTWLFGALVAGPRKTRFLGAPVQNLKTSLFGALVAAAAKTRSSGASDSF